MYVTFLSVKCVLTYETGDFCDLYLQTCGQVLAHPSLYDSLMLFSKTSHAMLQKVIVKIVACMTEHTDMRIQALAQNLDQVLLQIKHNASDREAWTMADTGEIGL